MQRLREGLFLTRALDDVNNSGSGNRWRLFLDYMVSFDKLVVVGRGMRVA